MPQISFVMPTKNRGEIISDSIKSIIDQTFQDWELIVVDDHSDLEDKTSEVLSRFNDSRIKFIKMTEKWSGGIAEARNFGNIFAISPIIGVADSDDISNKDRAQLTVDAFQKEDCDIFYGQYEILNKLTGELITGNKKYPAMLFSMEKLKEYNIIPHSSVAYKRDLIYDFPYNSFFRKAEDYDLFSRLASSGKKFYFCDKTIVQYVVHGGNITLDNEPGNYGKIVKSNRHWFDYDRKVTLDEIIEKKEF